MDFKKWVSALGFRAKDGSEGVFLKKYPLSHYAIEIDFAKESIIYGDLITCDSKTTQNFSQPENFVVLECVDRLLTKGYKPADITLEKTYPSGRGHSGRLDILVKKGKRAFLMIECKTWGAEFEKEYKLIKKNGGQLFTYFQNDTNADYLMLYASHLTSEGAKYRCEIIKIEDNYRTAGNVEDTFARWSKLTYTNGIFEDWVNAYEYQNKLLTKRDLVPLTEADSGTIFHGFLSILRKHSVSDKPNAFNKIFNLFLAKIYDEKKREDDELDFQWKEREDDPVEFQIRLINLHKEGLFEFLRKEIVGISDDDFESKTAEDLYRQKKERLKFNKIFDIKDVIDDESFDDNFRVLKEVVQLLEKYQIRYPRKQQHLSDFFERLLTTGLKQEAGQYFTPPPITKFIVRSLPIKAMIEKEVNQKVAKLPAVIDYAAGSGHFVTEIMEAYQDTITNIESSGYYPDAQKEVAAWQINPYSWAAKYIYGIEKDYRLVKVAKVGCYFYGDGLAQIIHGDGLDSFAKSKSYVGLLKDNSSKSQFSIVVSNPPYSVDAFKGDLRNIDAGKDFSLYGFLTDRSKEIECLFVERTAHLLKEGGVAGIILPSSILSNGGIYTKTREIILQNFEIVGITELGSNTFMATPATTVVLFLRKRSEKFFEKTKIAVEESVSSFKDNTINSIETPISKYVAHVWEGLTYSDYQTLLKKTPNEVVQAHEIYKEYRSRIKAKTNVDFWNAVLVLETEKILYFVMAVHQRVVLIRTGENDARKRFVGYDFSDRRGHEGIHPIERGKTIDECTKLFDAHSYDNPDKASTYIYQAFKDDFNSEIAETMKNNVSRTRLVDMLAFDRRNFEKTLSTATKKKVKLESKWPQIRIEDTLDKIKGEVSKIAERNIQATGVYPVVTQDVSTQIAGYTNNSNPIKDLPIILFGDHSCAVKYIDYPFFRGADGTVLLKPKSDFVPKYYYCAVKHLVSSLIDNSKYERHNKYLQNLFIPRPLKEIQQKIVAEIEAMENQEAEANEKIKDIEGKIDVLLSSVIGEDISLSKIAPYAGETVKIENITLDTYITTDNMLQNKLGVIPFVGNPNISSITKYEVGDVLVSNIRPYLKKIWFADKTGGCSKDVLVFRVADKKSYLPKFIHYMIRRDAFFDYVMEGKKGLKMPRGNKEEIMKYKMLVPSPFEQKRVVEEIEALEKEIAKAQEIIDKAPAQKAAILEKYL